MIIYRKGAAEPRGLGRATLLDAIDFRRYRTIRRNCILETVEDFVGGVLHASVWLMQLASRLGRKLTEFVAVGDVSECSKNKV